MGNDFRELQECCKAMHESDPALKCYSELPNDEFTQFIRRTMFGSVLDGFDMLRVIDNCRKNAGEELTAKYLS